MAIAGASTLDVVDSQNVGKIGAGGFEQIQGARYGRTTPGVVDSEDDRRYLEAL